ncbi:MAG: fumarylacetoacetate hydrolase family protein [Sedimentisphaerales bacterium]|nr:fumarylacetoacetate hydrolase family protein [Sedimentisphaerales bacterium]
MRCVRFVGKDGQVRSGIVQQDDTVEVVRGEFWGDYEATGEICQLDQIGAYLPPVDPPNIFAIGLNYREHARETGAQLPNAPLIFIKATTSLNAHQGEIELPKPAPEEVDFEAELVVVIGKKAKCVSVDEAADYIFGYTCGNDVTARDCQKKIDKQWARAKSFDTFAPVGPMIETELNPTNLRIRSFLNGDCMQDSSTSDLIFGVFELVSYLSDNFTLRPGTLIFTGTPPGVGVARDPQVFLRSGDTIAVEVEGLGTLENRVVLE